MRRHIFIVLLITVSFVFPTLSQPSSSSSYDMVGFDIALYNAGGASVSDFTLIISIGNDWVGWYYYDKLNITEPVVLVLDDSGRPLPVYILTFNPHNKLEFMVRYLGIISSGKSVTIHCFFGDRSVFPGYNFTELAHRVGEYVYLGGDLNGINVLYSGNASVNMDKNNGEPAPSLEIAWLEKLSTGNDTHADILLNMNTTAGEDTHVLFDYSVDALLRSGRICIEYYTRTYQEEYAKSIWSVSDSSDIRVTSGWKRIDVAAPIDTVIGFSIWWEWGTDPNTGYMMKVWLDNIIVYHAAPQVTYTVYNTRPLDTVKIDTYQQLSTIINNNKLPILLGALIIIPLIILGLSNTKRNHRGRWF